MAVQTWLVVASIAADLSFIGIFYYQMRGFPQLDRRTLNIIGTNMLMFVYLGFMHFEGVFLILFLASIAATIGICWLQHLGRLKGQKVTPAGDKA